VLHIHARPNSAGGHVVIFLGGIVFLSVKGRSSVIRITLAIGLAFYSFMQAVVVAQFITGMRALGHS
jgi:hypothetical protein